MATISDVASPRNDRMCCNGPGGLLVVWGDREEDTSTGDLQGAADRARFHSLCGSLVLAVLLSLRDVEELLIERGLEADHTTIWRWVQRYVPELDQRLRRHLKADQQVVARR